MSPFARSCLRFLFFYALAGIAVGLFVHHRFPQMPAAIWSGIIAGFFVLLPFGYLWAIPTNLLDWWRMRPGVTPRDGKRVSIIGTIASSGATLHAPFSKTPCVAYFYTVMNYKGQNPWKNYEGFAMVPSYVTTGTDQVRLLAYPDLDVPEEQVGGAAAKEAAREYLETTSFVETTVGGIKGAMAQMQELLADADGSIRYDNRIGAVADIDDCRFTEKIIRTGDTVCATGLYSEEKRALVTDPKAVMHAITIRKGSIGSLRSRSLRKAFTSAIGVVFWGSAVTAAAVIFLVNIPLDASEQMNPQRRFLWEEVKLERWLEKNVRKPLAQAGMLNTGAMYFLEQLCDHCATGTFEANGRVIPLRYASGWESDSGWGVHASAREGEKDGVTVTYDRPSKKTKVAVTMNGTEFVIPEEWLMPTDIQTARGSEPIMECRITIVAPSDSVRVRASLRTPMELR